MTILLHKPYMMNVTTKKERGSRIPQNSPRGLWITPYDSERHVITYRVRQ